MTRTEMIEQLEKENPQKKIRIFGEDGDRLYDTTVQDQLDEARGLDDEAAGKAGAGSGQRQSSGDDYERV